MEELVIQYIQDITRSAIEFGKSGKINLEALAYVIRNDKRKGKIKQLFFHLYDF